MNLSAANPDAPWRIKDHVAESTYQQLMGIAEPLALSQGTVLVSEGDHSRSLFLLESGALDVSRKTDNGDQDLGTIGPGDVVGEIAFVDQRPRSATVTVREDAQVLKLGHAQVMSALARHPMALADLMQALATRLSLRLREEMSEEHIQSELSRVSAIPDAPPSADIPTTAFLEGLVEEALAHPAVCHPYLSDLAEGNLPDLAWAIRDFAGQYPGYCAHFPRYLTVVISKLESADHRKTLLQNLTEESGTLDDEELEVLVAYGIDPDWVQGIPHPKLFERFQQAIGVRDTDAYADDALEVVCWRESFYQLLANGSPAEAIGAIGLGTENIVNKIYTPIIRAIERLGTLERRDYVFFELHCEVDEDHHEALLRIAHDFAEVPGNRIDLRKGMLKALGFRARFWDWMHDRARNRPACP
jgi:CRP-like cAMP-binding protein